MLMIGNESLQPECLNHPDLPCGNKLHKTSFVTPAKAGIHFKHLETLERDSRFRGNDATSLFNSKLKTLGKDRFCETLSG
ncbi:hypothetical protein V22_29390 [Calycomorphotria hydatis]|uniref:Uncharacterized protein n=1 Tax=Calycomorphotria hydatis TaxID=2528027 RepID=A0A517TBC8_9PLAN|nr:hypothetical protein V22_29390 [Calycomorphotria hydatis]